MKEQTYYLKMDRKKGFSIRRIRLGISVTRSSVYRHIGQRVYTAIRYGLAVRFRWRIVGMYVERIQGVHEIETDIALAVEEGSQP